MKILIFILGSLLIVSFLTIFCSFYFHPRYEIPVLMYHEVNKEFAVPEICVSPEKFNQQMRFLYQHNYNVLSLEKVVEILNKGISFPPRSVCITFDDGFEGVYRYAYPILKKYNFSATMFVTVNKIDTSRPKEKCLTWQQLKEMSDSGLITIGSHGVTHKSLASLNLTSLRREIRGSKELLEGLLNKKVKYIAYPLGAYNNLVQKELKKAGYKAAFSMKEIKKYKKGIYAIPRVEPLNTDNKLIFFLKTSGYYKMIRYNKFFYWIMRKYFNLQDFW